MKYRKLSLDELEHLQNEFIQFLIINGIDADEWNKIKSDSEEKAQNIIDQFSESVFESICRKVHFLTFLNEKTEIAIQFLEEKMNVIRRTLANESVELTEKTYRHNKEEDIFFLLNQGYRKEGAEERFKTLCLHL